MQKQFNQFWKSSSLFVSRWFVFQWLVSLARHPLASRLLVFSLIITGLVADMVNKAAMGNPLPTPTSPMAVVETPNTETPDAKTPVIKVGGTNADSVTAIPVTTTFPQAGLYLYGQSAEPDQLGQAYLVFEVMGNRVIGAFYMPFSSFDCFYGGIQANKLALTVIDSYERTHHPYEIALNVKDPIAGTSPSMAALDLQGYHPLNSVTTNDQRMLNICKEQYSLSI